MDLDPPLVPPHWRDLPQWHFLQADATGGQAQEWLPAACDILFTDAGHGLSETLGEARIYVPRVRPGGVALFHDTEWADPGQMLDAPAGPVTDALNLYCAETGRSWENRHGSYGLGIIRR